MRTTRTTGRRTTAAAGAVAAAALACTLAACGTSGGEDGSTADADTTTPDAMAEDAIDVGEGTDGGTDTASGDPCCDAMIDATSFEELGMATAEIVTDPEIAELLESVPTYGEQVAEYTADRCGVELEDLG